MEASDMLDVIHVFFEDDMIPQWEQGAQVQSAVRESIYESLYKKQYKYKFTNSGEGRSNEWHSGDSIYAPPAEGEIKPYFPPSSEEELMSILDPPLG